MADGRDLSFTDRLVGFLTESGLRWLVILGSAIRHFGAAPIASFLLGAASVYVYAMIWPLPGTAGSGIHPQPPQTVILSGEIKTIDNEPLPRFKVALRGPEFGPFDGGRFELTGVQRAEGYSLIVWPYQGYNPVMMFGDMPAMPDGDKPNHYRLEQTIQNFPNRLGRVIGKLTDQTGRPLVGEVEIAQRPTTIKPDGSFEVMDIPLGNVTIEVMDARKNSLLKEPISMELGAPTPFERKIRVPQ